MRVLLINCTSTWGGREVYLSHLVPSLLEDPNYEVRHLVKADSSYLARFAEAARQWPQRYSLHPCRNVPAQIPRFLEAAQGCDIINVHRPHDLWIGLLCKLAQPGRKLVYSAPLYPRRRYLSLGFCDLVIANSHSVAEELRRLHGDKLPMEVIYPGVDVDKLLDMRRSTQKSSEVGTTFTLMMGGALHKNQTEAVRVLARVREHYPETELELCSPAGLHGASGRELRETIDQLGLRERVRILTDLSRPEYLERLARSHVFVYTYDREPFGIVLLEAALLGKPIVSYRCGGGQEILDSFPGTRMLPSGDIAGVAAATCEIIASMKSGTYDMQEPDREVLDKFSLRNLGSKYARTFQRMVGNERTGTTSVLAR